jgi:hypothetical protein
MVMTPPALQTQLAALQQALAQHVEQSARRHAALQQGLSRLATALQLQQTADAAVDHLHQEQSAKRAHSSSDGTAALCKDVILDTVFSFVGIKDYIYAAGVSRHWRVRYLKLCYSKAARADKADTISKLRTSFRNAAMTAVRLQVAFHSGLNVADLQLKPGASASALVRHSLEPIAVLTSARVYGLQWTADYTRSAASRNDTQLVQWLLQCGCPYDAAIVCDWAQQHGNLDMLKCCDAKEPLSCLVKIKTLLLAGMRGHLHILEWLRGVGAAWPVNIFDEHFRWTLPNVQWALANGRDWTGWGCQQAHLCVKSLRTAAEHNDAECTVSWCHKRNATALFVWAHEHGCPCTCDTGSSAHSNSGDSDNNEYDHDG